MPFGRSLNARVQFYYLKCSTVTVHDNINKNILNKKTHFLKTCQLRDCLCPYSLCWLCILDNLEVMQKSANNTLLIHDTPLSFWHFVVPASRRVFEVSVKLLRRCCIFFVLRAPCICAIGRFEQLSYTTIWKEWRAPIYKSK